MTTTQFSTREVPWMKIGKLVEQPVSSVEAAKLGGLDFDVELRTDWYTDKNGDPKPWPHRRAIVRVDTDEPYDVVSYDYRLCQYREAFEILDHISKKFVAAGSIKDGKQGFMVVEAPDDIKIQIANDPHDLYVVARTSHDRSRALEINVMPLRQVCMNQLPLQSFSSGAKQRWSIVHNNNMADRIEEARASLHMLGAYANEYTMRAQQLMKMEMSEDRARKVLEHHAVQRYVSDETRDDRVDRMIQLWKEAEQVGWGDSAWGVVQAVSEFYQWDRASAQTTNESMFLSSLQGELHKMINTTSAALLTGR